MLDSTYPGIRFDAAGVCNYCGSAKRTDDQGLVKKKYEDKFNDILGQVRGKGSYDCVLAYSGGKDSTYTLHLLKSRYGLRVLAVSFDNWFQSDAAKRNIEAVVKMAGVDHIFLRPRFDVFSRILHAAVEQAVIPKKALERATAICTVCLSLIRFGCFRLAIDMEVPVVVLGLSPGQSPEAASVFKANGKMLRSMQEVMHRPLREQLGSDVDPYFLEERHFLREDRMPHVVNPLAFLAYSEKTIYEEIARYGWLPPKDTDSNSSNCLLNGFAVMLHREQHGFHPYAFEIAGLVRQGCMTREEGMARLAAPVDQKTADTVAEALEFPKQR